MAESFLHRRFGDGLDPLRALGHNTKVLRAYGRFEQGAGRWRSVERTLAVADMATVARIGCPRCTDLGYWVMHSHGISPQKIEAVPHWRDSELFDPLERLVTEYGERATETPPTVDDELVNDLLEHLDEAQLLELTMVVYLENVRSRFTAALGMTSQGFKDRCKVPPSTP
jgi:alkylhydroperoxidase family enzyme